MGGTLEVRTEVGRGSTFVIRVPLTLAIVRALLAEAGGERYAVPLAYVAEFRRDRAPTSIQREAGRRIVDVTADLAPGVPSSGPVLEKLEETTLPALRAHDVASDAGDNLKPGAPQDLAPELKQAEAQLLRPLEQRWQRRLAELKGQPDARLDDYRWLLEELRVSLFAQELRTPQPVSVKRLEKTWAQLQG